MDEEMEEEEEDVVKKEKEEDEEGVAEDKEEKQDSFSVKVIEGDTTGSCCSKVKMRATHWG